MAVYGVQPENGVSPSVTPDPEGDMAFLEEAFAKKTQEVYVKKIATYIDKVWQTNQRDNKNNRKEMNNLL